MKRLAAGCTSDSHPLYGMFLSQLSASIFEWDADEELVFFCKFFLSYLVLHFVTLFVKLKKETTNDNK